MQLHGLYMGRYTRNAVSRSIRVHSSSNARVRAQSIMKHTRPAQDICKMRFCLLHFGKVRVYLAIYATAAIFFSLSSCCSAAGAAACFWALTELRYASAERTVSYFRARKAREGDGLQKRETTLMVTKRRWAGTTAKLTIWVGMKTPLGGS